MTDEQAGLNDGKERWFSAAVFSTAEEERDHGWHLCQWQGFWN